MISESRTRILPGMLDRPAFVTSMPQLCLYDVSGFNDASDLVVCSQGNNSDSWVRRGMRAYTVGLYCWVMLFVLSACLF
jgi:hypothetical protein